MRAWSSIVRSRNASTVPAYKRRRENRESLARLAVAFGDWLARPLPVVTGCVTVKTGSSGGVPGGAAGVGYAAE